MESNNSGEPDYCSSSQDDEALMEVIKDEAATPTDKKEAREKLYERYYSDIYNRVRRKFSFSLDILEDVVESAFEKALIKSPGSFKNLGKGKFRKWLHRIASNTAKDAAKKSNKEEELTDERMQKYEATSVDMSISDEEDEEFERREREEFERLLVEEVYLTPKELEVAIALVYTRPKNVNSGDAKPGDVAEALGLPPSTVYNRISRIKEKWDAYEQRTARSA